MINTPLTYLENCILNFQDLYKKNPDKALDFLRLGINNIKEFYILQREIEEEWTNYYHSCIENDDNYDVIKFKKLLDVKYYYKALKILLKRFELLLFKIQASNKNKFGLLPTFKQLELIINTDYNINLSLAILNDNVVDDEDTYYSFGDANMLNALQSNSKQDVSTVMLNYAHRYLSLLKKFVKNEEKSAIIKRLSNSSYHKRKGMSVKKFENLILEYDKI